MPPTDETARPLRLASRRRRAAWIVAGGASLLISASAAGASPAKSPAASRDRSTATTDADEPAVPEVAPAVATSSEEVVGPAPDAIEVVPPSPVPPALGLEGSVDAGATEPITDPATAQAVLDAAWEGVDGFVVELELQDHQTMVGRVGAVQRDTFTLIQADTGAVLVLPKSGVVSLRVHMPPPLPTETGSGALIGGAILTTLGSPVFVSGVVFLGICSDCVELHLPMLFVGGGALAGGITLLARGTRRRNAYREAMQERSIAPVAFVGRQGQGRDQGRVWLGGLSLRF
ncbi:hypothetical protein [Paraliomyxa miuraensis]|uniref:hypothetical protein n=1 Tax=Paraliomyxa miuraensis TaxID=376150 RepID=UPI00225211C5|nr:hypothetical protein [Paraliomyxa miuraensis]MCX4244739.1 hypothetical protein [Paraliomyxa miuraensis]